MWKYVHLQFWFARCKNYRKHRRREIYVSIFSCVTALRVCSRDVWPDGGEFGASDISPEEEFMALREVFFADLPREYNTSSGWVGGGSAGG